MAIPPSHLQSQSQSQKQKKASAEAEARHQPQEEQRQKPSGTAPAMTSHQRSAAGMASKINDPSLSSAKAPPTVLLNKRPTSGGEGATREGDVEEAASKMASLKMQTDGPVTSETPPRSSPWKILSPPSKPMHMQPSSAASTQATSSTSASSPISTTTPSSQQQQQQILPTRPPLDCQLSTALRSSRDRVFILRQEQDMHDFVLDTSRQVMSLALMNSYQRLLVHRCAELFGLERDVDPETKAVSLKKNSHTKIPSLRLIQVFNQEQMALKPTDISPFAVLHRATPVSTTASSSQCPSPIARSGSSSPAPPDGQGQAGATAKLAGGGGGGSATVGTGSAAAPSSSSSSSSSSSIISTTAQQQLQQMQLPSSFRIMRRDPSLGSGAGFGTPGQRSSSSGNTPSDQRTKARKDMTIEEREAAYREARQRIFGGDAEASTSTSASTKEKARESSESSSGVGGGGDVGQMSAATSSPSSNPAAAAPTALAWAPSQHPPAAFTLNGGAFHPTNLHAGQASQWHGGTAMGGAVAPGFAMDAGAPSFQSYTAAGNQPQRWPVPFHPASFYDHNGAAIDGNANGGGGPQQAWQHVYQSNGNVGGGASVPSGMGANTPSLTRFPNGSASNLSNCDAFSPFPPTPSANSSVGVPSPAPSVAGSTSRRGGARNMPGITRRDSSTSGAGTECSSSAGGSARGGGCGSDVVNTTARAQNWLQGQQAQQWQWAGGGGGGSSAAGMGGFDGNNTQRYPAHFPGGYSSASAPLRSGRLNVADRTLYDPSAPSGSGGGAGSSGTSQQQSLRQQMQPQPQVSPPQQQQQQQQQQFAYSIATSMPSTSQPMAVAMQPGMTAMPTTRQNFPSSPSSQQVPMMMAMMMMVPAGQQQQPGQHPQQQAMWVPVWQPQQHPQQQAAMGPGDSHPMQQTMTLQGPHPQQQQQQHYAMRPFHNSSGPHSHGPFAHPSSAAMSALRPQPHQQQQQSASGSPILRLGAMMPASTEGSIDGKAQQQHQHQRVSAAPPPVSTAVAGATATAASTSSSSSSPMLSSPPPPPVPGLPARPDWVLQQARHEVDGSVNAVASGIAAAAGSTALAPVPALQDGQCTPRSTPRSTSRSPSSLSVAIDGIERHDAGPSIRRRRSGSDSAASVASVHSSRSSSLGPSASASNVGDGEDDDEGEDEGEEEDAAEV